MKTVGLEVFCSTSSPTQCSFINSYLMGHLAITSQFYPFLFQIHDTSKRGSYRTSYTQQDLADAHNAVFEERIPVERAAKRFGVHINTLKDREKISIDTVKSGPSPLFS